MATKMDYKIALKDLYSARPDLFALVDVPSMQFVMDDGEGGRVANVVEIPWRHAPGM